MTSRRIWLIVLLAAGAAAPIPLTHRIYCSCELQPSVRRYVVAPFDGFLLESSARPGDLVRQGEVLARLDPRELQHEAGAAAAERDRAYKSSDVHRAGGNAAAAQLDRLEAVRLDERCQLLEQRLANLEVRSPLTGIVISGQAERVAGAPLKSGQTLFEIAPLERMIVETAVAEADYRHVSTDQPVTFALDAIPDQPLQGRLGPIRPRCEIRENQWVFLAEWELANADGRLRPGMRGRATIAAAPRSAGWIVLHHLLEVWRELRK